MPIRKATSTPATARETDAGGDYLITEQIGYLLRVAMQRHTAIFRSMMPYELTQTQYATLVKLLEHGPATHNLLGRLIELDAPTIKGVIDRLIARDFVVSTVDPEHKRRREVALTPLGREVTLAAREVGRTITEATLASLSAPERRQLAAMLRRLS